MRAITLASELDELDPGQDNLNFINALNFWVFNIENADRMKLPHAMIIEQIMFGPMVWHQLSTMIRGNIHEEN